jgi:hypothetical protein
VALVVIVAATAQYLLATRAFAATQELRVAVLVGPEDAATGDAAAQQADVVAQELTSSAVLASPALATVVLASLPPGASSRDHVTPAALERALTATHNGTAVALRVQWPTASGADAILAAAVATLQRNPALLAQLISGAGSARVQADAPASPAARIPGQDAAARDTLLTRIALGLLAALLLPFALAMLLSTAPPAGT